MFGEVLLDPTPLYGPLVEAVQAWGIDLHYAVHVTGHGLRKLMRAEVALSYVIEDLPPVPPIFRFLCARAGMSDEEAYGTFNMGIGFALYLPQGGGGRRAPCREERAVSSSSTWVTPKKVRDESCSGRSASRTKRHRSRFGRSCLS